VILVLVREEALQASEEGVEISQAPGKREEV
jgi:hypothetical protein